MRIVGLLAVLGACAALGLCRAQTEARTLRCLEGLCAGIRCMREELAARLAPLDELLPLAAARAGEAERFFRRLTEAMDKLGAQSFGALWCEACRELPLLPTDVGGDLEALGATLGRAELSDQLAACDRFLARCEAEIDGRRRRLPEQRRLFLALGAAAGLFLCLLIL